MKRCLGCMKEYQDELNACPHCGYAEGTSPENALHMIPGTILADRYIVGKVIGFGGFGVTYIGWDALLETKIAIKEYLPSEFSTRVVGQTQVTVYSGNKQEQFTDGMKKFVDEAKKLAKFHSTSGIVKIFDSFEANNTAYIVMELLEGETLAELLEREKKISDKKAVEMMTPIIESLKTVHDSGIIHRDIAPDNIFVTKDGEVKLIDFGAARYATTTHSRSLTVIIKPGYSPEEQYRSRGDQGTHTDVYAVAATLYKMITGVTPRDALERRAFFENQQKDVLDPISKYVKNIDQNCETAILNALNVRIEDRTPDMQTFLDELTSEKPVERRVGKIKKLDVLKWPLWAKIGVPVLTVVLITFGVLFGTGVIGFNANLKTDIEIPDGQTRVPSVISDNYEQGEQRLEDANLLIQYGEKQENNNIPENHILSQSVTAGTLVEVNTLVEVSVSAGKIEVQVPHVVGLERENARLTLENVGFTVTVQEEYNNNFAKDYVVSQSLQAGSKVSANSDITIVVSLGRDPSATFNEKSIKLPDFVGMNFDDAMSIVAENELTICVAEYRYSKQYKEGQIIEQDPVSGTTIKNTQVVNFVVSLGFSQVEVPDVTLMSEEQAKNQLESLGLKVVITRRNDETVAEGLVISQDPEGGKKVDPETEVQIVVSEGATSFSMPNVVGKQEKDAVSLLNQKGLSVTVSYKKDESKEEGEVLAQDPKSGASVKRGDSVVITVCTHDDVVSVPDVVGQKRSDAEKKIKDAGLEVNVVEVENDTVEKGVVISQSPIGGTGAKLRTQVTINVSKGRGSSDTPSKKPANRTEPSTTAPPNTAPAENPASMPSPSTTPPQTTKPPKTTPNKVEPESISLNRTNETVYIPYNVPVITTTPIVATISPSNVTDETINWSCDEGITIEVSTYEKNGCHVSLYDSGTYTLRATTSNGLTATCVFTVIKETDPLIYEERNGAYWVVGMYDDSITNVRVPTSKTVYHSDGSWGIYSIDGIAQEAFRGNTNLRTVTMTNLPTIEDSAFEGCTSLTSVKFEGVGPINVGTALFSGCENLNSVSLGSITSITDEMFFGCTRLSQMTIPDSVTQIGAAAFYDCGSLRNIEIPSSVSYIDDEAFSSCSSLYSVIIHGNPDLGSGVFYDCFNLTIYCDRDSTVEEYAKNNDIPYGYI